MDPRLDENEEELRQRARRAAEPVRGAAAQIDADCRVPRELLAAPSAAGCLGIHVAAPYGGGGGALGVALVVEELGAASAAVGDIVVAHLAALSLIEALAGDRLEERLLPDLVSGARFAALVVDGAVSLLEEPRVSITAVRDDNGLRLDGTAGAVSGAAAADLLVVPATADGVLVAAVVAADTEGVVRQATGRRLGLNGSGAATVSFDGAQADELASGDVAAALGAVADLERIGHAALCVGIGRAASEASTAFARTEGALEKSQSVQWMLADNATETEAARMLTWYAASRTKADELREAAAMARLLAAEAAVAASRRAVQIMGEAGNDPEAGVERLYRDAKAMEVHHGAAESQREQVARQLLPDLFA